MNKTEEDTTHAHKQEDERDEDDDDEDEEKEEDQVEISCQASVTRVLPPELQALAHVVKQIQEFLMTTEEAIMEAARTGACSGWKGSWKTMIMTFPQCIQCTSGLIHILDAAVVNDKNGDIDVVRCLLDSIYDPDERNEVAWEVLEVAAERGHCSIIELACPAESIDPCLQSMMYFAKNMCNALFAAVINGRADVVNTLLDPYEYHWDVGKALDDGIRVDNKSIVELIYGTYPEFVAQDEEEPDAPASMLDDAAEGGHLNAVKYLLERGHDSLEEENRAFIRAVRGNCVESLAFFRGRGRIFVETLNKAFEFAYFGSTEAVEFLHEKGSIAPESIAAGFKLAALYSKYRYHGLYASEEKGEVMRFMCSNGLVPPDLFSEVFLSAASDDKVDIL